MCMKIYNFPVVITQEAGGMFMATVPSLAGCHTQAKSLSVLNKRIGEAIELCLAIQKKKNEPIFTAKFIALQQVEVSV